MTPFATAGDEMICSSVEIVHFVAPVAASKAYTFPSPAPTYTMPFATAGDEKT